MNIVIREYVEELFSSQPQDAKTVELKEELAAHLSAKFEDLVASGMPKERAFSEVISGVGNVQELVNNAKYGKYCRATDEYRVTVKRVKKEKDSLFGLISGTFWLVVLVLYGLITMKTHNYYMTWTIFVLAAAGQNLLSYYIHNRAAMYAKERMKTAYNEADYADAQKRHLYNAKAAKNAKSGALWCSITFIYFIVSFVTHSWAFSWIIFIIGAIGQNLLLIQERLAKGGLAKDGFKEEERGSESRLQ